MKKQCLKKTTNALNQEESFFSYESRSNDCNFENKVVSDHVQWIRDIHGVHWQLILPETTWEILSRGGSAPQASLSVTLELCENNNWKPIGFIRLESCTRWPKAAPAPVQTMTCISEQKPLGENREGHIVGLKNAKLVHIWKWVNSDYYFYIWNTSGHFLCVHPTRVIVQWLWWEEGNTFQRSCKMKCYNCGTIIEKVRVL